jgi:hypothetical protein
MKSFKIIILSILFSITTAYANNPKYAFQKEKKISKIFKTTSNPNLSIINKYGNINVTTWEQNTIAIDITIEVNANNQTITQEMLDLITIEFNDSKDKVSATTHIGEKKRNWWDKNNSNSSIEYKINYTIKTPINTQLELNNKYGNIYIDKLNGALNLKAKYGSFSIGELNNSNNNIAVKYFKLSDINYIKRGNFTSKYSKFMIDKAEDLNLASDYCDFNIDTVSKVNFNNRYGTLIINKATELTGDGKYIKLIFRDIKDKLLINTSYGSLQIKEQTSVFSSFTINVNYTSVNINMSEKLAYQFNVSASYGSFREASKSVFSIENEKYNNKQYIGYYGNENSKSTITASLGYGNLKIRVF